MNKKEQDNNRIPPVIIVLIIGAVIWYGIKQIDKAQEYKIAHLADSYSIDEVLQSYSSAEIEDFLEYYLPRNFTIGEILHNCYDEESVKDYITDYIWDNWDDIDY